MGGDREREAERLREIEARLAELSVVERAGQLTDADEIAARLEEVNALFGEAKRLALDAHTSAFARISIQAAFLIGRLEIGLRRARE